MDMKQFGECKSPKTIKTLHPGTSKTFYETTLKVVCDTAILHIFQENRDYRHNGLNNNEHLRLYQV